MARTSTPDRLRLVLLAVTLAANALFAGLLTNMVVAARERQTDEARTAAENVALLLDVAVTEVLARVDLSLRATAEQLESELSRHGRLDAQAVAASLDRRHRWSAEPAPSLRVTDAAGNVLHCAGCTPAPGTDNLADRAFFTAQRTSTSTSTSTGAGLFVGALAPDGTDGAWSVWLSRRYETADQRFGGIVAAAVPTEVFRQIFSRVDLGAQGTALLRDAQMALVLRAPPVDDPAQQPGTSNYSRELADIVASGATTRSYHTPQSGDGVERMLAYRRLSAAPFHVVAGMAAQDYLAEWRALRARSVASAVVFLLASTGLAWMLWRGYGRTRAADERYRLLLRHASDGVHILDGQRRVVETSDAFCAMLGYTRAEMIGMHVQDWDTRFSGDSPAAFAVPLEGGPQFATFETRVRRKDGHLLEAEITVRALKIGEKPMFMASARDISERKRAVRALTEREGQFRKFFLDNGSVMLLVEPWTGEVVAANGAALAYYGHRSEHLVGMPIEQISTSPTEDLALQRGRALRQERSFFNARHRLASGEVRDVEVYASPIEIDGTTRLFCIVHDVSRRRAAEETSRRLSSLYAALSECSQAIVHCATEAELFPKVCHCVVAHGFAQTAWIGFVNAATQRVEPVAVAGGALDLGFFRSIPMSVDENDVYGRGLTGTAIRRNQPQWTQDFLNDPITAPWRAYGETAGWRSTATMPLCRGGVPVGCMVIYSDRLGAFDEDARQLLGEMAMNISFALDNFGREAERQRSLEALLASEARYRQVFQTSLDAIAINRVSDDAYLDVNEGFVLLTGHTRDEVIGRSSLALGNWARPQDRQRLVERMTQGLECRNVEIRFRKKSGELGWGLISATRITRDGVPCVLSITRDITDIRQAQDEIRQLALYDPLTELANRRMLTDVLQRAQTATEHGAHTCALLFVDLDNFKFLNDSSGHAMGDLLLQQVARRLLASVRTSDTVARFGGDEFIVLVEPLSAGLAEAECQARTISAQILAAIREPYLLGSREHRSTASIGITLFAGTRDSTDTLLGQADIAMYRAKAAGRNTVRFFSPDLQAAIQARAAMEADLHRAIAQAQFLLHYQP